MAVFSTQQPKYKANKERQICGVKDVSNWEHIKKTFNSKASLYQLSDRGHSQDGNNEDHYFQHFIAEGQGHFAQRNQHPSQPVHNVLALTQSLSNPITTRIRPGVSHLLIISSSNRSVHENAADKFLVAVLEFRTIDLDDLARVLQQTLRCRLRDSRLA